MQNFTPNLIITIIFSVICICLLVINFMNPLNMESNFIEVTNSPSTITSTIVIIITILVVHYNYTRIYGELYKKDKTRKYNDVRAWYFGTYSNAVDLDSLVEDEIISKITSTNLSLDDIENTIIDLSNNVQQINDENVRQVIDNIIERAKNVNLTNEQIIQMNDIIMKAYGLQTKNVETLNNVKQLYIDRFHVYLDDMIRSLEVIQYQYNIASVTTSMNGAMGQLENLYNAIRGTIVKYIDNEFIPTYINNDINDPNDIPSLETKNVYDRTAGQNYNNITKLFQTYRM